VHGLRASVAAETDAPLRFTMSTKRPPGRPPGSTRVLEPRATVSVWLPASAHDRLIALAKKEEQSISKTVRELLKLKLP
jgi:hypothetical protein